MDKASRRVELLSPAKDLTCGIEAVKHGADAVYVGAPKFGARAAAGNSVEDIRRLCDYAHTFGVNVYVALNTILKDCELGEAERIIHHLYSAGADALIIQDMGITRLDIPPIPLHASTQTDNRSVEKVSFLQAAGFSQVVLARELTLEQIQNIAENTSVRLEVFVHGALCTGYSGQCYVSEALCGRSANRGECAQYCRLPYDMTDASGKVMVRGKHLLSLRDLNLSDSLEALLDAGVSSFKIEGRLKDLSYVKNITAWYRRKIDDILARRPQYCRSSAGKCAYGFEPAPEKSFNRGFTDYFLTGRKAGITAFDTPKHMGQPVGVVREHHGRSFSISAVSALHNGDGLTFFNAGGQLEGFRVNRVEAGKVVFPAGEPALRPGTALFRNHDHEFERLLAKPSAERKIAVELDFTGSHQGFALRLRDETGVSVSVSAPCAGVDANGEQHDNIVRQLSKLGSTDFVASAVRVSMTSNPLAPSSLLSDMRRRAVDSLIEARMEAYRRNREVRKSLSDVPADFPAREISYTGNVANVKAAEFYREHGVSELAWAFELSPPADVPLMYAVHCLKYSLGYCPARQQKASAFKEPFYLTHKDVRLRLQFDCRNCHMLVYKSEKTEI
ncbi:MAG: U32 family peptidase [Tannerellaceae bacterium]|jgi:putative protease|nr:U32 family peptidase [Tannerellaceae bacterium]